MAPLSFFPRLGTFSHCNRTRAHTHYDEIQAKVEFIGEIDNSLSFQFDSNFVLLDFIVQVILFFSVYFRTLHRLIVFHKHTHEPLDCIELN